MASKRVVVKRKVVSKFPLSSIATIKSQLQNFRDMRKSVADLTAAIGKQQRELVAALTDFDQHNVGVVFAEDDEEKGAAFVQQNKPTEYWNQEAIVAFLKKDPALWRSCSSRVYDPKKWEAEVANGNIPKSVAEGFKEKGEPPSPFIRFGKPKKDSLR